MQQGLQQCCDCKEAATSACLPSSVVTRVLAEGVGPHLSVRALQAVHEGAMQPQVCQAGCQAEGQAGVPVRQLRMAGRPISLHSSPWCN